MPFWLKNGLDRVNGGIYTCLDRDGSLIDSTKSVWFQGRFAFVCSFAYNTIEKNPEYLQLQKAPLISLKHTASTATGVCTLR